jgi:hypothetical protein
MKEVDLRMLAERGVGFNASVLTVPCGYVLQLETSKGLEVLRLQRGGERVFKTLDAVAALLGSVGITSFSVELQSSVSIPPLCSNPRDYNHGGLPPLVPAIGKSVIPQGNNAVTEPPSFRGRDLFSDLGVYPLQSPKADPPRAKRKKKK